MNLAVSFTPANSELVYIEEWLIEERNASGEGFHCNWSIVKNFYDRKELAVLIADGKAVGFACWRKTSELTGQINIFEIQPEFRSRGMGTFFTNKLLEYFLETNTYVIDLQCVPEISESFWRRFGFKDVPPNIHYWDRQTVHLFKPLVPCAQETLNHNGTDYIEIWDDEPYAARNKEAKWKWNLFLDNDTKLSLPIIQPCEKDWRIKLVQKSKVIVDNKIKRFGSVEIDHGPYAIIVEIPKSR